MRTNGWPRFSWRSDPRERLFLAHQFRYDIMIHTPTAPRGGLDTRPQPSQVKKESQSVKSREGQSIRLCDIISGMSCALDITEGQPEGHSIRSCLIAMRIADVLGLPESQRPALFFGTLLKDAGCSSNASRVCSLFRADDRTVKRGLKTTRWTDPRDSFHYLLSSVSTGQSRLSKVSRALALAIRPGSGTDLIRTRCTRGADIAEKLGFDQDTAEVILNLDEHWNGRGEPLGLRGDQIPMTSRIACLAQTAEVYFTEFGLDATFQMAMSRSDAWFDPDVVRALMSLEFETDFWWSLGSANAMDLLASYEPHDSRILIDEDRLDLIAEGFADVVDAKSPWTYRHSNGVAEATAGMLRIMGYEDSDIRYWRRVALLHDIGKLGVSNLILDKPGRLTDDERVAMKTHTEHTRRILSRVPVFQDFADVAAAHHEKLDGSGYSLGLTSEQLSRESRVLTVADIFDALSSKRPYRDREMSLEQVIDIMESEVPNKLCPEAFEAMLCYVYASL